MRHGFFKKFTSAAAIKKLRQLFKIATAVIPVSFTNYPERIKIPFIGIKAGLLTYTAMRFSQACIAQPSQFPNDRLSPTAIQIRYIQRQVSYGILTRFPFHFLRPLGIRNTLCEYLILCINNITKLINSQYKFFKPIYCKNMTGFYQFIPKYMIGVYNMHKLWYTKIS